jgi:hypothetical protein
VSHSLLVPQSSRFIIRCTLASLAVVVSACGQPDESQDVSVKPSVQESSLLEATFDDPCSVGANNTPPTLSYTADLIQEHQCGDSWEAPVVTAVDSCGNPLAVHKYNTGDDDGDGIPGSSDPDDFGPGPNISAEGTYYVQYLAWDAAYNIQGVLFEVTVVDCP